MRAVLLVFAAACSSSSSLPNARFANRDVVRIVNDRRDVAKPPAKRDFANSVYHFEGSVRRPLLRVFELEHAQRALGVNALDEVPDSTWFTNRIGVRPLTLDEIRTGPITIDSPANHLPWTVTERKQVGRSLGFYIADARGERFLIKFDPKHTPELETANEVITGRLLWAAGYNVPEDFIVRIRRQDLRVAPNATYVDGVGKRKRLLDRDVQSSLRGVAQTNGRIRVLASRIVPGYTLGGHPQRGIRRDDPNDRIPHERRRDLRGARPIFAWLDHADITEGNTLDVWVADPARDRHYVAHYWVDFGKSLGAMAMLARDPTRAYEYTVDYTEMFGSLVTLGTKPHVWARRNAPALVGVGLFERDFDPSRWKPSTQAYEPLLDSDRFDWLWGAKIVMRFTRDQIRAAVEAGELSDSRATRYVVDTLVIRQRAVGAFAFSRVQAIDNVAIDHESALCFDDLGVRYRLRKRATDYVVTTYDRDARRLATPERIRSSSSGHVCTHDLPLANTLDRYTIWELVSPGEPGRTYVHVASEPVSGSLRVIGLWRE
jgi:hypothetical protein